MDSLHLEETDGPDVYGRIFRSMTSGICIVDARLRDMPIAWVNPAFERMTGYSQADIVGKNCRLLQGDDHAQPGLVAVRKAIVERCEVVAVLRNYRKDGTAYWNEISISPIRNTVGMVTHFVGVQSDVTERVEYEAALRESEKLAVVGRLAASIAHEINNPLESLTNLVYLAQGSKTDEEVQLYLGLAEQELRRVKLITARSLRFYKQTTKPVDIRCEDLVRSVLDVYAPRLADARIETSLRSRDSRDVPCLDSEIRQVLSNLISNAMDAMVQRGGRLQLRMRDATAWRTGEPGVLMTVADDGTGIAPEDMKNLAKAFFTTKGIAGTGLGLWISREIIQRHGGSLKVRSQQKPRGGGTVMQLFLPCKSALAAMVGGAKFVEKEAA